MKKVILTLLVFSFLFTHAQHTDDEARSKPIKQTNWQKNKWIADVVGGGFLNASGICFMAGGGVLVGLGIAEPTGYDPLTRTYDNTSTVEVACGSTAIVVGAGLIAVGSWLTHRGIKYHKKQKATVGFIPNSPSLINRYQPSFTKNRVACITLTF